MTDRRIASVTVLICTCNRATRLDRALRHFDEIARPPGCGVELIVVDNNSSDGTAVVIDAARRRSANPVRYVFERRQGKGFALNTGLALAHGDIVALTDDDVEPAADWLERIVAAFRSRDIVFVSGKVLPAWMAPPPPMLLARRAHEIWGPLALVDYGESPVAFLPGQVVARRPIGANVAFRRSALESVGGWRCDLGKAEGTLISGEDHEIFFRLDRAGLYRGVYDPRIVVHHDVPEVRLTRRYFRGWFFANGRARGLMADSLYPDVDFRRVRRLAGVPRFLFRQLAMELGLCLRTRLRRSRLERLIHDMRVVRLLGVMWQCRRTYRSSSRPTTAPTASAR